MIPYFLSHGARVDTVVAFNPSNNTPVVEADSSHPHWSAILELLEAGDESVFELFDVAGGVMKRLRSLSDRIDYDGTDILFDGDKVHSALSEQIKRFLEQGVADYKPLVKFWEKVAQNPDDRSREQLFTWLQSHDFTITEEGDIVGYKGVVEFSPGEYQSSSSGTAFVDGKKHEGRIPNKIGTVVTMPRAEVNSDPNVACHKGLHVGDWSYASNFAGPVTLEVHVNPRDVVSIPRDSSARKMRCCKYKVIQRIGKHYDSAVRPKSNLASDEWSGDVGYAPQ